MSTNRLGKREAAASPLGNRTQMDRSCSKPDWPRSKCPKGSSWQPCDLRKTNLPDKRCSTGRPCQSRSRARSRRGSPSGHCLGSDTLLDNSRILLELLASHGATRSGRQPATSTQLGVLYQRLPSLYFYIDKSSTIRPYLDVFAGIDDYS